MGTQRFVRVALAGCVSLAAAAEPAAATDDGYDYNKPFRSRDISDCVYTKARTGIAAFAYGGSYVPFQQDFTTTATVWPGCEGAPGAIRVLKLQVLTVRGRATYLARGG